MYNYIHYYWNWRLLFLKGKVLMVMVNKSGPDKKIVMAAGDSLPGESE
jgi:hypothetical protein